MQSPAGDGRAFVLGGGGALVIPDGAKRRSGTVFRASS
jgi:hypothetical protein